MFHKNSNESPFCKYNTLEYPTLEHQYPFYQYQHRNFFMDTVNLMKLPGIDSTITSFVKKEYLLNVVLPNVCINLSQLLFSEIFYVITLAPKINDELKV